MYELNNKAVELSKKGKLTKSIDLFNKALEENPLDTNINFNLALVYVKKEDFISAIKYLKNSIKSKKSPENLRELGICYIRLKKFSEARESLEESMRLDNNLSETYNVLGVLDFQEEKYLDARGAFEKAVELDPENRDAWFNLKDTYNELGMTREEKMAEFKYNELNKNEV
jgi:tetratricopeptide (TPR) repeat protein